MRIIEKLNQYLQTWQPFNDFYKILIGDEEKSVITPTEKINDENTGTIANPLMWLSDMGDFLIEQSNINDAQGKWLTNLKRYYGVVRQIGETDEAYRLRLKKVLLYLKETPVNIEQILSDLADDVEVLDGIEDGMFDDVSFDDYYVQDNYYMDGSDRIQIKEAVDSGGIHGQPFYFKVLLTNPDMTKLKTIAYLVYAAHCAGTYYDIFIIA